MPFATIYLFLPYLLALLLGSLPVGLIIAHLLGIDVRSQGSGNIGATNVARVVSRKAGLITLLLDIIKGVAAVTIIPLLFSEAIPAICGIAAVLGHCFSFFLSFRGGKGVATSFGAFSPVFPLASGVALLVFFVTFKISRKVSLSSIAACSTLGLLSIATSYYGRSTWTSTYCCLAACIVVVIRHQENIKRILQGTEPSFGAKDNLSCKQSTPNADEVSSAMCQSQLLLGNDPKSLRNKV